MANDFDYKFGLDFGAAEKALKKIGDKLESTLSKAKSTKLEVDASGALKSIDKISEALTEPKILNIDVNSAAGRLRKFAEDASKAFNEEFMFDIETKQAVSKIDFLNSAFDESRAGLDKLVADQTKALKAMATAGDKGTVEYEKLLKAAKENIAKLKQLDEAARAVDLDLDINLNTDKITENVESIADTVRAAFSFEAIGNIGDQLSSFAEKGTQARDAMNNLAARTGLTGEALKALKANAEDAFVAGIGESVAESIEIMGAAQKKLGDVLDPSGLQDFVLGAGALKTTFGNEIPDLLDQSRSFIKSYGLEGKEAFNLIALGIRDANTADEDFLDTLKEYSPLMKQAGFDADEFVGTLIKGGELGAWNTDKIADSIKETGIRLKAGDISTAITEFQTQVPEALFQTIQGATQLAESGQISIKELLNRTAGSLEEAFDAGQISDTMRSKLQIAISGTPAEELGTGMYGKIFGAPINVNAIKNKAKLAGDAIQSTLGPITFAEKMQKEMELIASKSSQVFTPFIAGAGGALQKVSEFGPGIKVLQDNFDNIQKFGAKGFDVIKNAGAKALTGLKTSFATGTISATTFWSAATFGIPILIGGLVLLYENFKPFQELVDSTAEKVSVALDKIIDNVMTVASAVGEVFSAVSDGDFDIAGAFKRGEEKAKKEIADSKLADDFKNAFNEAADLQIKVEAVANTDKLIADFEKAQADVQVIQDKIKAAQGKGDTKAIAELEKSLVQANQMAENFATTLAQEIPSSVAGVEEIRDANGELSTSFKINIDSAKKFTDAQKNAYSSELSGKQKTFNDGLALQAEQFKKNNDELKQLGETIDKGGASPEVLKRYDELKKKVNESGAALKTTAKNGKQLGFDTSASVKTIATAFGISEEAAKKLLEQQKNQTEQAKATAAEAAKLATAFTNAQNALTTAAANNVGAGAEIIRQIAKLENDYRAAQTKEEKENFKKQLEEKRAALKTFEADARKNQAESEKNADLLARQTTKSSARAVAEIASQNKAASLEDQKREELDGLKKLENVRQVEQETVKIEAKYQKLSLQNQINVIKANTLEATGERKRLGIELGDIERQTQVKLIDLKRGYDKEDLQKFIDAEAEKTAKALTAEQTRIENTQALIDRYGGGLEQIKKQGEDRVAFQKKQGEDEARAFIEGTGKYKAGFEQINAQIGAGQLNLDQAKEAVEKLRETIAQEMSATRGDDDDIAKAFRELLTKQTDAIAIAQEDNNLAYQRRQLDFIEDTAQRELKIQLFELGVQHRERMKAVKGNRAMEIQETREFESEKLRISTEAVLKTSKAYTAALAFVENFRNNLENAADTAAIDRANKDLDGLKDEEKALEESYKNREISHRDYTAKLLAISQARADKEREIEDAQFSFKKAMQGASLAAFKKIEEERMQKVLDITKRIADDLQLQIEANADSLSISSENLEQLGQESLAVFGAQMGQLMAQNVAFLDAMAISAVSTINKIAQAAIFQNIGPIYAASISALGPIAGPIAATGAIALVLGLLASAEAKTKAALSGPNKFADGVVNLRGPGTGTSDSIPAWLSKGETVMRAEITRRELPLFEHLHDGGTSEEFFINKHGRLIRNIVFKEVNRNISLLLQPKSRVPNAEVTAGFDRHTAVLKSELRGIKSEIKSLKNTTFQRAEHTIKVKSNPKEMLGATIEAQYKALNY